MKALYIHAIVVKKYTSHRTKNAVSEKENILNRGFVVTDINSK